MTLTVLRFASAAARPGRRAAVVAVCRQIWPATPQHPEPFGGDEMQGRIASARRWEQQQETAERRANGGFLRSPWSSKRGVSPEDVVFRLAGFLRKNSRDEARQKMIEMLLAVNETPHHATARVDMALEEMDGNPFRPIIAVYKHISDRIR